MPMSDKSPNDSFHEREKRYRSITSTAEFFVSVTARGRKHPATVYLSLENCIAFGVTPGATLVELQALVADNVLETHGTRSDLYDAEQIRLLFEAAHPEVNWRRFQKGTRHR